MLGSGHGPGAGSSTHLMQQQQQSQRYPGSGPGPDSGSHYREQQQQQQHGSLSPSHMGPPPRSFHADQQGSMSMSMTMSMVGDEAMSPQDRSRSALYPTQGPGSETTTSTTSSAGMGSQQQPGQFPGHHRGSTGTISDPLQPMHHRQRQNSLPHVLEHHSQFTANSPHYLHPLSDGFVSPSSSGGGSAVGGVRPISPNSAQQQSPLRSQYAYQGNGNTGSSSNGGSIGDTRVAEYIPEQEHRQKNMHHHQHHQQQQNQHQHHQQQHHPHHQQHHHHQLQHRHQHYDPAHPHTFQPPPPRIERHGQEPSTPLSSFQPSRTSVQSQHRGSAGHSGKTMSLLHVEDSQKKNVTSAPGGANSSKGGDVKMMMTHTSGSRSGSGPTSEPRLMTTISGTGTSSGGRAQSSGNIHAPSMAGLSMSGPSSTSSSSPTVGGGPQAMIPSSGSGSIGGGGTVGAGGGGGLKSGRGEGSLGARTQFHAPLEPEVIARLDELFFKFLQRLCSECKYRR
ncbi:hypothetical protein BGZ98_007938 [Dissophora globulifera]|nr:hypothetical protein BGZ98_007938 [Dissophora globulifera]